MSPRKHHIVWTLSFIILNKFSSCGAWQNPMLSRRMVSQKSTGPTSPRTDGMSTAATTSPDTTAATLLLFNSKTRQKEPLLPLNPEKGFRMYTCGPTVYDYAHVGNFRAFLTYDILKRVLLYLGYDVEHVCNLTDVDDKIINRANKEQIQDIKILTRKYEELFFDDLKALNIMPATHYPRATEYIPEMMDMIRILAQKGLAYETSDGSWYFRTQAQPGYGKQLVNLDYSQMESTQDRNDEGEKEHFADFCLWKAFKDGIDREDAAWEAPDIHKGRPGWHLECSAMSRKFFGDDTIDLHGGGVDLQFPHHENEIAQSEGVTGQTFCNCWFHNGFVNIDNEKMSKSLGNFKTLRDACPTNDQVRAYRYLIVSSQSYRNPLSFTPEVLKGAQSAIARMDKIRGLIQDALSNDSSQGQSMESTLAKILVHDTLDEFRVAIQDDLSMPRASACLFRLVKAAETEFKRAKKDENGGQLDTVGLRSILEAMNDMDRVFGIFYEVPSGKVGEDASITEVNVDDASIPDEVLALVSQRSAAKDSKDFALADSLRARIAELGYSVKDVKDGEPIVSRLS